MSPLSNDRWRLVSPYLDRALDMPVEERAAWLDALRGEDSGIAADVLALLREHDALSREGFLSTHTSPPLPEASLAGLQVGAYTLRSPLGQGGMGNVWLAQRSDGRFEGTAAVKLLNASLVGPEGESRFKREGSLLARLHHPHIAQLIDAGVSSLGQPYLVLEHVDGERIDAYCDRHGLGIEARVRKFLDVLGAVAFAHANLVVHRDLKPPNVLVGRDGQVKLLDFGIAKLLQPESDGTSTLTREGAAAMTPAYAAPEQLTGGSITTGTDVYALGVVLFVLLTGRHPAEVDGTSPADWINAVVGTDAPRPSDKVVAKGLRGQLKGDLDNIVAKALKKQPGERYASVEAMADDLRRYLHHQPVSARADSIRYRAAKFVRRNRGGVAAAAIVAAALLAGTWGVAWQAREARIQRDAARTQLARATAANEFTSFLLSVGAPAGKAFNVTELLAQGEVLIEKQFSGDPALKAEMLVHIAEQHMEAERWDQAKSVLERAATLADRGTDPALQARVWCPLSLIKILDGDPPGAEALMHRALTGLPDDPQFTLQRAECLIRYSQFGFLTGDAKQMIARAEAALTLMDQVPISTAVNRINAEGSLAYGYYLAHQNRKADETYAKIMVALEAAGVERTVMAADALNNWGLVHFQGDLARAEPICRRGLEVRRAIEGERSVAPTDTYNYAGVLVQLARYSEAEPLMEETIRTAGARGERRVEYDAMMSLAGIQIERGDLASASAQLERVKPHLKDPLFNTFRLAQWAYWTGRLAEARGDAASARAEYLSALEVFDREEEKIALNVQALIGLARVQRAGGDGAAAAISVDRALALAESFIEKDAPSYLVGLSLVERGRLQRSLGSEDAARATFKTALEHLSATLGPDHPATKNARREASS